MKREAKRHEAKGGGLSRSELEVVHFFLGMRDDVTAKGLRTFLNFIREAVGKGEVLEAGILVPKKPGSRKMIEKQIDLGKLIDNTSVWNESPKEIVGEVGALYINANGEIIQSFSPEQLRAIREVGEIIKERYPQPIAISA